MAWTSSKTYRGGPRVFWHLNYKALIGLSPQYRAGGRGMTASLPSYHTTIPPTAPTTSIVQRHYARDLKNLHNLCDGSFTVNGPHLWKTSQRTWFSSYSPAWRRRRLLKAQMFCWELRRLVAVACRAPLIRLDSSQSKNDLMNGQVFCAGRFSLRMHEIDCQHFRPKKLNKYLISSPPSIKKPISRVRMCFKLNNVMPASNMQFCRKCGPVEFSL